MNALPDLTRTVVVGTTGSGKTTLGLRLAALLNVPFIELDKLHWGPEWDPLADKPFRELVSDRVAAETWVVDGNYGVVRDIVWQRATTIVWLDYPLPFVLWRLFRRTTWRVFTRQRLFNGNREPFFASFFSRDSLFMWALRKHHSRRQRYNQHFADNDFANATPIVFHKPAHAEAFIELVYQMREKNHAQ